MLHELELISQRSVQEAREREREKTQRNEELAHQVRSLANRGIRCVIVW